MFSASAQLSRVRISVRMYTTTPVIDFERFRNGTPLLREQIAAEVDAALRTTGFFFLRNHGIAMGGVEACFQKSKEFFSLSTHEKEKLRPKPQSFQQGYIGVEKEKVGGHGCLKESFDFANPIDDSLGLWPTEAQLPGFRKVTAAFYQDCSQLMDQLLECLSIALGLDSMESLGQHHDGSLYVSNLIHYPEVSAPLLRSGKVIRDSPHSDLSTLSLHFDSDVGGLQVADMGSTCETSSKAVSKTAKFYDVNPNPSMIMVNAGHLLMRWTNGRWKNSVHRVSEPPLVDGTKRNEDEAPELLPERYSIAFFGFPSAETMIEPLKKCSSVGGSHRWEPIKAGDYLLRKRAELYS